jgi:predicted O-methyltransferase YrrM
MNNYLRKVNRYLSYRLRRKGKHSIHSPFVYDFVVNIVRDRKVYDAFKTFKHARKRNFTNKNVIETVDFGAAAGKKKFLTYRIAVNKLAKKRSSGKKEAVLLYKVVKFFKPSTMLELGTSVGMGSIPLAMGNPDGKLVTIEGCASVASVAQSNFSKFELTNIEQVIGNFDIELQPVLNQLGSVDLVYFDGNHRKKPTLRYFEQCLEKAHENSIFIFDDIYASEEMVSAWKEIKQHPKVSISLDFFHLGMVFFKKGVSKQDFALRM